MLRKETLMKATTPQKVHKVGVRAAIKAINKELRSQKHLIKISGSENRAISNLQDSTLLKRVVKKFEKAGWFVDVRETKGMTTYLRFRIEPQSEHIKNVRESMEPLENH